MKLDTLKKLVERVSRIEDISIKNRKTEYIIARCAFFVLANERTKASYRIIGEAVGRDHAGAYNGIHKTAPSLMTDYDNRLSDLLDECRSIIDRKKIKNRKDKIPAVVKKETDYLRNKVSKIEDPFIKKILELEPYQYEEFKNRAEIMLKFVTSSRFGTDHRKQLRQEQE